jgi:hypothetical protein
MPAVVISKKETDYEVKKSNDAGKWYQTPTTRLEILDTENDNMELRAIPGSNCNMGNARWREVSK